MGYVAVGKPPDWVGVGIRLRESRALRLALKLLLVGAVCHLSTEIGFAHKFPPHYISPLWPTGAILFSVLVVTPVRHWWAYTLAAYFTSVINDARAGFPLSAILFIVAGIIEIWAAAAGVRRYAGGLRAFDSLRSLIAYIVIAAFLAPFASAFVAAFAGGTESYWFYWRAWFLSEALAFLTLAPAILAGIAGVRIALGKITRARCLEACLLVCGLLAASVYVFARPTAGDVIDPARVYLPLPFLLWAAVRFGPLGVNSALLVVACLSISGAVHGRGPFVTGTPAESVLSLQLFLVVIALPLMLLAALVEERREKTNVLSEAEEELRESHRELRALTGRLLQGQESERRRIAREMHDDWTQRLAVLGIDMAMLEQQLGAPDKARSLLHSIQGKLMRLTEDVHALSRQLHPSILDDLGLVEALRSECAAFSEREGIAVSYCPNGVPDSLPKDVALCVYRIAQEALRNIAKHASVDKALVSLTATGQELQLRVQDRGAGFDATGVSPRPGLGLSSMQERARLVQAALLVTSEPGLGTTVLVRVPSGGVPHEQVARVVGR
jgi:two-component system sensor histidine kinase UhpB